MEFIHQRPEWPNLTWDYNALADRLAEVRYNQGLLLGHMQALSFDLRSEAALTTFTSDVITSSAIEGQSLNPQQVHFEAPEAKRIDREMRRFLDWFNRNEDTDPILKAGIARTIADMLLACADGSADRFYSMSSQIEAEHLANISAGDRSTS
jgi:Fic family protein